MLNIETEFKNLARNNPEEFPDGKDYLSIYNVLKPSFDKQVHQEIKTKILEIEKEGYFNDHGVDHIKMVVDRASKIISSLPRIDNNKGNSLYLNPYELFILLIAINIHDVGHLIGTRKEHAKLGKKVLASFDKDNKLSRPEKIIIGKIAQAHGGKNDPIGLLEHEMLISHKIIRPQLLAAILRLADELAEDSSRASSFLLQIGHMEPTSEIFHRYSESLDSIRVLSGEIKMELYVEQKNLQKKFLKGDQPQFLIDEIYERTLKTFTESLYCSRFLPEKGRINTIRVNIHFCDDENNDEIMPPLSYTLKESGYPLLSVRNIYEVCPDLTSDSGEKNGIYFSKKIDDLLKIEEHEESV